MSDTTDAPASQRPRAVTPADAGEGLSRAERLLGVYAYECSASNLVYHHDGAGCIVTAREAAAATRAQDKTTVAGSAVPRANQGGG